MSKFCIDLEDMMLPDAIAAVVEAWYDAQSEEAKPKQNRSSYQNGESIQMRARKIDLLIKGHSNVI